MEISLLPQEKREKLFCLLLRWFSFMLAGPRTVWQMRSPNMVLIGLVIWRHLLSNCNLRWVQCSYISACFIFGFFGFKGVMDLLCI